MTRDAFDRFIPPDRGRFGDNESAPIRGNDSVRSNLAEIDVVIHHGTDRAVLVSIDGTEARAQWLPRSAIEIEHKPGFVNGTKRSGQKVQLSIATVMLPMPMAREKGLV